MKKKQLTQISITSPTKLSPASKTQIEWKFIWLPQLASILNSIKCILCVVVGDKAIVVSTIKILLKLLTVNKKNKKYFNLLFTLSANRESKWSFFPHPCSLKCTVHSSISPKYEKRSFSSLRVMLP